MAKKMNLRTPVHFVIYYRLAISLRLAVSSSVWLVILS